MTASNQSAPPEESTETEPIASAIRYLDDGYPEVDLSGYLSMFKARVQSSGRFVAFALVAAEKMDASAYKSIDKVVKGYTPSNAGNVPFRTAREEFRHTVVERGVTAIVDEVNLFLEQIRAALLIVDALGRTHRPASSEEWRALIEDGATKFHRFGLPDKLKFITERFPGITLKHTDMLLRANSARACLTHRAGIVGPRDVSGGKSLVVTYLDLRMQYLCKSTGQFQPVPKELKIQPGGSVQFRAVDEVVTRSFPLGTRIRFTPEDCIGIGYTITVLAHSLVHDYNANGTPLAGVIRTGSQ